MPYSILVSLLVPTIMVALVGGLLIDFIVSRVTTSGRRKNGKWFSPRQTFLLAGLVLSSFFAWNFMSIPYNFFAGAGPDIVLFGTLMTYSLGVFLTEKSGK